MIVKKSFEMAIFDPAANKKTDPNLKGIIKPLVIENDFSC